MKCIFKKLLKSGIWTQPLIMAILILCINYFNPNSLRSLETWMACFIISFLIVLFILIETLEHPNEEESITGKKKALYPKIPKELLHDEPAGMILGKDKKQRNMSAIRNNPIILLSVGPVPESQAAILLTVFLQTHLQLFL